MYVSVSLLALALIPMVLGHEFWIPVIVTVVLGLPAVVFLVRDRPGWKLSVFLVLPVTVTAGAFLCLRQTPTFRSSVTVDVKPLTAQ